MQRHEDLRAARKIAGITQSKAAGHSGVNRTTYNAWENGKSPIPEAKYLSFLEAIGKTQGDVDAYFAALPKAQQPASRAVNDFVVEEYLHSLPRAKAEGLCASILRKHPQPAPKKIEYDRKGYPLGIPPFGKVEYDPAHFKEQNPGVDVEQALIDIEGASYPAKGRERALRRIERMYPNGKDEDHLQSRARHMRSIDADMASYYAALSLEHGWPCNVEEARAIIAAEEARLAAEDLC